LRVGGFFLLDHPNRGVELHSDGGDRLGSGSGGRVFHSSDLYRRSHFSRRSTATGPNTRHGQAHEVGMPKSLGAALDFIRRQYLSVIFSGDKDALPERLNEPRARRGSCGATIHLA
jgi:hypothetical protein